MSARRALPGRRLILRPFTEADLSPRYLAWLADPDVTRFLEVHHQPVNHDSALSYLARFLETDDEIYMIVERASGIDIGTVTLNGVGSIHQRATTGLLLGEKDRWGRGYAADAWTLVIDHAFRDLKLRKVIAGVCKGNSASLRVLDRLGFKLEGTLREECFVDARHVDALRLGLLRAEFIPAPSAFAATADRHC